MKIQIQRLSEGIHEINNEVSPVDLTLPDNIKFPEKLEIRIFIDKFEDAVLFFGL